MIGRQRTQMSGNAVLAVFAHRRRRDAIRELRTHENPIPLADLADQVAVREHGTPISEIPAETVKRIYLSLYHTHIPKLADADLLRYDQERDAVALSERAERVERPRELLARD